MIDVVSKELSAKDLKDEKKKQKLYFETEEYNEIKLLMVRI